MPSSCTAQYTVCQVEPTHFLRPLSLLSLCSLCCLLQHVLRRLSHARLCTCDGCCGNPGFEFLPLKPCAPAAPRAGLTRRAGIACARGKMSCLQLEGANNSKVNPTSLKGQATCLHSL